MATIGKKVNGSGTIKKKGSAWLPFSFGAVLFVLLLLSLVFFLNDGVSDVVLSSAQFDFAIEDYFFHAS